MDFAKIKLIIWDLDDTLWRGTITDGDVCLPDAHARLIRDMADAGVISSICSKNDEDTVRPVLQQHGLWDLFVFTSVNWSPKGARVKQIIEEMALRPQNVLFIDDNPSNLAEAQHACAQLMTAAPDAIAALAAHFAAAPKTDPEHKRLSQYKVLQRKRDFRAESASNEDFLRQSNIRVEMARDCAAHLDRIADLVQRSNQLNFTKVRSTADELRALFADPDVQCGYASVRDSFGDYGIVGFYAVKDGACLHFVFSCRTLGMGVEQYVYRALGCPALVPVGEVASDPAQPDPVWINLDAQAQTQRKHSVGKLLIKGPCDMSQIFAFIQENGDTLTEFTYVGRNGVSIEGHNHTAQILTACTHDDATLRRLIDTLPFGDEKMFTTALFDPGVGHVVLSLFTDPNLGLYREKRSGAVVAFGEYHNDLTDEARWPDYIAARVFVANCRFTQQSLRMIKDNFDYLGRLTPAQVVDNLRAILARLAPDTRLILNLGSETPYEANDKPAYADRHLYNRELNALVRAWAADEPRVALLDVNPHITGQDSFLNNINHFVRRVYYDLSADLIALLAPCSAQPMRQKSLLRNRVEGWLAFAKKAPRLVVRKIKRLLIR